MYRTILLLSLAFLSINLAGQYSLDDILSVPYASDLTKSKEGNAIAWVSENMGKRSINLHMLGLDTTFTLYQQEEDLGQVISGVQLDDKGDWLYFFEGSGKNREGVAANPASTIVYPERKLYRMSTTNGSRDTLGAYNTVVVSPSGAFLLLPMGDKLFRMDTNTKKVSLLAQMRGNFSSVKIASDNKSCLFVSLRGDHNFIGHLDFSSDRINWVAPGVDMDLEPQFSPEGDRIVFLRMPGHQKNYLNDITSGSHFQIMMYTIEAHQMDTLWSAPNDSGGFAQYYHSNPLRWTDSGKVLFYSEHEGHMKIYVLDPSTHVVQSVIEGPCEVEHSDVSPDGKALIFSSNCEDIDRRNIHVYDLSEGEIKTQTNTSSIETHPLLLADGWMAYEKGSHNEPAAVFKSKESEIRLSEPMTADFPKAQLVTPQGVTFTASDGTTVHGQLFDNGSGGKKPGVLFMHGGPIRQMLLGYHYSGYYANCYAFNQYLASKGYVVLSVNYRAGIGYGRDFRRAPDQGPRGASEYQDIVAGARFIQNLPQVDSSRIGLWGGSYGGYLTAMGLAKNSDIFKAGVDLHGVHDWAWRAVDFSEGGFWGIGEDDMSLAFTSSPAAHVATWRSPVLFIHGDDDRNVMFGQTIDLVQRLREKAIPHEILILPDEVHGFYRWESWLHSFQKAASFFDRKL